MGVFVANLNSKEFALIENLEAQQSQRGLAKAAGLSLGMTNMLLRRLIKKGYVKVVTLNGRTLRYMLTPTGFAEKVKRSYDFLIISLRQLNEVRSRIRDVVAAEAGHSRPIWVAGQNELAGLAKDVLREAGIQFEVIADPVNLKDWSRIMPSDVVVSCEPDLFYPGEPDRSPRIVPLQRLVG